MDFMTVPTVKSKFILFFHNVTIPVMKIYMSLMHIDAMYLSFVPY